MQNPTSEAFAQRQQAVTIKQYIGVVILLSVIGSFILFDYLFYLGALSLDPFYTWFCATFGAVLWSPTGFHILRLVYAIFLMGIYALIDFGILPGRKYKIRQDLFATPEEVLYYIKHSIHGMILYHVIPLGLFEYFWFTAPPMPTQTPSFRWLLFSVPIHMLVFDTLTFIFHALSHYVLDLFKGTRLNVYFTKEHHIHHDTPDQYTYSWTGYFGSWAEAFAAVVFFTLPLYILKLDPLTKTFSCFWFHIATTNLHSGYDFPFFFHNWFPLKIYHGSVGHYIHHQKYNANLATFFSIYDHLFNTYINPGLVKKEKAKDYIFLRDSEDLFPELSFVVGKCLSKPKKNSPVNKKA